MLNRFSAYLSNGRVKTKVLRARAKSQLNLLKLTATVTLTGYFFKMVTVT